MHACVRVCVCVCVCVRVCVLACACVCTCAGASTVHNVWVNCVLKWCQIVLELHCDNRPNVNLLTLFYFANLV